MRQTYTYPDKLNLVSVLGETINSLSGNANAFKNSNGQTSTNNLITFTDGTPNGLNYDSNFNYSTDNQSNKHLSISSAISLDEYNNGDLKLTARDTILTNKNISLEGDASTQRYLTVGKAGGANNVKTYVDITTQDYICNNQIASQTKWTGAVGYYFDNDVNIGTLGNTKKLYINGTQITSGAKGDTGDTGPAGPAGQNGLSSSFFKYRVDTSSNSGTNNGHIRYQNNTQISSTYININHIDQQNNDIDVLLNNINAGDDFIIQDANNSLNYQKFLVTSIGTGSSNSYVQLNVSLVASDGTGTTNFSNNHQVILIVSYVGPKGDTGPTGPTGLGITPGLLRAINCNLHEPTTIYNIVWSNLTPQQQLEWKGLDSTNADPVQSITGNYWNFTKTVPSAAKVGWFIPVDLSGLTFQYLESFWCVVRFNNNTSISGEGSLFFSIYTSPATAPNFYRTRINYQNPATVMNQTGYFYKIHCQDTITTTTIGNFGRAQEVGQTKFKTNPMNVRSDLWNIPFNKVILAGDTLPGYTNAPILAISLQTASNINTFNFDVVSIGYLDKQYNLLFS